MTRRRRILFVLGYVLAAVILDLASGHFVFRSAPAICYPPAGLYLAAILIFGWRALPLAFLSPLFHFQVTLRAQQIPWMAGIGYSAASLISPALMILASRQFGFRGGRIASFTTSMAFVVSVLLSVAVECMGFAGAGVLTGSTPSAQFSAEALYWWVSIVLPYLALTPALLCLFRNPSRIQRHPTAWSMTMATLCVLAVGLPFSAHGAGQILRLYLVFLPVLVGALVFGDIGGRWANLLVTCSALMFAPLFLKDPNIIMEAQFLLVIVNVVGLLAGATVDERREADEALRASENKFRTYFENSLVAMGITAPDKRWVEVNDRLCTLLGYSRQELLNLTWIDVSHPDDHERDFNMFNRVLTGEFEGYSLEKRYVRKDGSVVHAIMSARIVRRPDGLMDYSVVQLQDITQRKRSEEALRESRQRLALLVEQSPMAVIEWDLDFRVVTWNSAAQAIFGYTSEEALGFQAADLIIPPHVRELVDRVWKSLIAQTGGSRQTNENVTKDGRTIVCDWYNTTLIDQSGKPVGVASLVMDVTERRHAEEQRYRLEDQLRQAQKMESVGRLAGGVAHDINNMLTPILGYAEILKISGSLSSTGQSDLDQVIEAGTRCKDLVQQLLAFARRQTLEMRPIVLNEIVTAFQKMLRHTLRENIVLETHTSTPTGTIMGDSGQIEQIILNLALNAQDAMPEGGKLIIETATVQLDEEYARTHEGIRPGPYSMIAVSDTGVGMDHKTLERVFDPFFTTKQLGKGTGLGLATVYGIVRQHRGNIFAYSEPGKGSTFRIYFPQTDRTPEALPATPQKRPAHGVETVLVVEDQAQVRSLACRILSEHGYKVVEAASGEAALDLSTAMTEPIHLLVTDVVMTGIDGKELHRRLESQRPGIRVLFMSGYTTNVIGHHGVLDPDVDFIQKPFSLDSFATKVREILDRA